MPDLALHAPSASSRASRQGEEKAYGEARGRFRHDQGWLVEALHRNDSSRHNYPGADRDAWDQDKLGDAAHHPLQSSQRCMVIAVRVILCLALRNSQGMQARHLGKRDLRLRQIALQLAEPHARHGRGEDDPCDQQQGDLPQNAHKSPV